MTTILNAQSTLIPDAFTTRLYFGHFAPEQRVELGRARLHGRGARAGSAAMSAAATARA
jgi:hypothetical protein